MVTLLEEKIRRPGRTHQEDRKKRPDQGLLIEGGGEEKETRPGLTHPVDKGRSQGQGFFRRRRQGDQARVY
jgi:hypothetical protein